MQPDKEDTANGANINPDPTMELKPLLVQGNQSTVVAEVETSSSSSGCSRPTSPVKASSRSVGCTPLRRNQTTSDIIDGKPRSGSSVDHLMDNCQSKGESELPPVSFVPNEARIQTPSASNTQDSIQVDEQSSSPLCHNTEANDKAGADYYAFTLSNLCGPRPKKIGILVFLVMAIWASLIIGWHVNKKVSGLEAALTSVHSKLEDLEERYVQVKADSTSEIDRLHDRLRAIGSHSEAGRRQRHSSSFHKNHAKGLPSGEAPTKSESICTEEAKTCVFPFTYKGETYTDCIDEWHGAKSWCATRVGDQNEYLEDGGSSWGYCSGPCNH